MEKFPFYLLTIILIIAVVIDIRCRRIPNWLTFSTSIIAIIYHAWVKGTEGLLFSLKGLLVGIAVLIIPYLMGGIGAGDVKLMGAIGGLLGPKNVFTAFLVSAIMGGFYAFILLVLYGHIKETLQRYGTMLKTFLLTQKFIYVSPSSQEKQPRLCYGVAIALGTTISIAFFN